MKYKELDFGEHIPKQDLVHGAYYIGICRNARIARWNAELDQFLHWREKFGYVYKEGIKAPEDYDGFDVFVPLATTESGFEIPFEPGTTYVKESQKDAYFAWCEEVNKLWDEAVSKRNKGGGESS